MTPGFHEDLTRRSAVRPSSDRQFGLVVGVALAAIALWPLLRHGKVREVVLGAALAMLLVGALVPTLLHPLNRVWASVGAMLGRMVNPVAMALLFYLVFTPIGLLARLFGKDSLHLRAGPDTASYWIERQPAGPPPETMANQF